MRKPKPCNCRCTPPTYNCLGCTEPRELPTSWIMDFPAAISYSGADSGSIVTYNDTSSSRTISGVTFTSYDRFHHTYEWILPDISNVGNGTVLQIDDAPKYDVCYGLSTVDCIWADNNLSFYWAGDKPNIPAGYVGCPTDGVAPDAFKGPSYSNASPWYYFAGISPSPNSQSPNRIRNAIPIDDARCGTNAHGTCTFGYWNCNLQFTGAYNILRVSYNPSTHVYTLTLTFYLMPAVHNFQYHELWSVNESTHVESAHAIGNPGTNYWSYSFDGWPAHMLAAFPTAASYGYIRSGPIYQYSKDFICADEFDGTPVVLPLTAEYSVAGAPQTMSDAIGILNRPTSITLTPVI